MWKHNEQEEPPAPFLEVIIHHPETNQAIRIDAKIDTGADISPISLSTISELGLPVTSKLLACQAMAKFVVRQHDVAVPVSR